MSDPSATPPVPAVVAAPQELPPTRPAVPPIPRWVLVAGIPVMVLIAVAGVWLLLAFEVSGDRLDAIRTGSTLGVGLGGVVVLWLAVRRQRSTELDLLQKYEAHHLAERMAAHSERDATARRITDLYGKAIDQLGSDKALVRMGGLHALERLAQDNPDLGLRQTVVNVLCAYLRMPRDTTLAVPQPTARPLGRRRQIRPGHPLPAPAGNSVAPDEAADTPRQEREIRETAQRILITHLRPGHDPQHPADTYWGPVIRLMDLA